MINLRKIMFCRRTCAQNVGRMQQGVSLVEVLVAIVIFAFGLLAIAGLQLAALKYQKGAWSRAGATTAIVNISERMQANRNAALSGSYNSTNLAYSDLVSTPSACTGSQGGSIAGSATECTAAEVATNDHDAWFKSISSTLPKGRGRITGDSVNGFIATVMWFDKDAVDSNQAAVASEACPANVASIRPTCCPINAAVPAGFKCVNTVIAP